MEFLELLKETPECNDFRRLATGEWIAYSVKTDRLGLAIRAQGSVEGGIKNALERLRDRLRTGKN